MFVCVRAPFLHRIIKEKIFSIDREKTEPSNAKFMKTRNCRKYYMNINIVFIIIMSIHYSKAGQHGGARGISYSILWLLCKFNDPLTASQCLHDS
jgi:hypothetical protein